MSISTVTQQTMLSTEIVKIINDMREEGAAELRHDHFMAKVVKVLGEEDALNFRGIYLDAYKREKPCYALPKREANLMVMSESYKVQAAVYDRMVELEAKVIEPPKPASTAEMILGLAQVSVELERKVIDTQVNVKRIEARVDQMSVDLRNGVPHGFISRKNARSMYASGLSLRVFEDAMIQMNIPKQSYVSVGDGYSTVTYAYQEDRIPTAISHFVRDLEQVTKRKCFSRILNRRVDFEKTPQYGLKQPVKKEEVAA
jgi:hypothetical protein